MKHDLSIHQANAKVQEIWRIGLKWAAESSEPFDARNYMMVILQMMVTEGLVLFDLEPKEQNKFMNQVVTKFATARDRMIFEAEEIKRGKTNPDT